MLMILNNLKPPIANIMKLKYIVLLSSISLMAACAGNQKPVDLTETKKTTQKASGYETGKVSEKALSSEARLPGQLKPYK